MPSGLFYRCKFEQSVCRLKVVWKYYFYQILQNYLLKANSVESLFCGV